ncbi:MAG: DAK2 domain-containing protein [Nitriliruptorales bacterium]|nr:DAK2 domain-containing protein [Nitriliruptorales bacterium]
MTETSPRARLDAADLADVLAALRTAFRIHAAELDALNVFPVPDGDTGANMLGTVMAAGDEASSVEQAVRGGVVGARGNSGVILSQVLRALLEGLENGLTGASLPAVLRRADALAREAVAEPVEGTMLTVLSAAAASAGDSEGELAERLAALLPTVSDAVAETQHVLEANRTAGVVDAGARGIEVCLRALHDHVWRVPLVELDEVDNPSDPAPVVDRPADDPAEREQGSDEFRWEVQYLHDELQADDDAVIASLQDELTAIGDSVVIVSAGDILNVHVHTNEIGAALEAGLTHGHPRRVSVTDFEASDGPDVDVAIGLVLVLPGAVLAELVAADGVAVVDGRAGDLPTVGDLLAAERRTHGHEVILVPGHRNVVPTALQAAATSDRTVHVVEAANALPKALAAAAAWAPEGDPSEVVAAMDETARHVRDGEVVAAVRDADTAQGRVRRGDFLGLVDDEVVAVGRHAVDVADDVLRALTEDGGELLLAIAGASAPRRERRKVAAHAGRDGLELELFVTDAGPARWWFGLE